MYKCRKCNVIFEKPIGLSTTYEKYFGVSDEFDSYTTMYYEVCPYCESEEFYEMEESVKYEKKNNKLEKNKHDISRYRKP